MHGNINIISLPIDSEKTITNIKASIKTPWGLREDTEKRSESFKCNLGIGISKPRQSRVHCFFVQTAVL